MYLKNRQGLFCVGSCHSQMVGFWGGFLLIVLINFKIAFFQR